MQSPTYCKLSHVSLAVQNEGDVCVCNKNTESFKDGKWNKLYLHTAGLEQMWASPTRKLIVSALDHGKRLASCQACWDDEDAGNISARQYFNKKLADVEPLKSQPRILIIKPTNTCNMGCRMCQPSTSTTLYQDFYEKDIATGNFSGSISDYTKQFETIRLGLGKNNLSVWDTCEKWLPELALIDIYGGEPMLAPALWDRIIAVSERDSVKNTAIKFHTNGTIWNQSYIDTLDKFKDAKIQVSIDSDNDDQLRYIRHKVDVDKLYNNLAKYISLSNEHTNISVGIALCVSIYNVWYVDVIYHNLKKRFGLDVNINIVYGPDQYDMRHLPKQIKQHLIEKFQSIPYLEGIVNQLKYTVPGCDVYWPKFWEEVEIFDKLRNQSFADTFPEYYTAIKPYLVG
jgi:organic radical activating enzyme